MGTVTLADVVEDWHRRRKDASGGIIGRIVMRNHHYAENMGENMSRVLVTAPVLVVMPGTVLKLNAAEAKERRLCTKALSDGFYKVTLENHFKKGQIVEFKGEIPKHFVGCCETLDDAGRVLPPARPAPAAAAPAEPKKAEAGGEGTQQQPETKELSLDTMTKAQLLDFAERHQIAVDGSKTNAQIRDVLKRKTKAAA